jgi:hypothetical protein
VSGWERPLDLARRTREGCGKTSGGARRTLCASGHNRLGS